MWEKFHFTPSFLLETTHKRMLQPPPPQHRRQASHLCLGVNCFYALPKQLASSDAMGREKEELDRTPPPAVTIINRFQTLRSAVASPHLCRYVDALKSKHGTGSSPHCVCTSTDASALFSARVVFRSTPPRFGALQRLSAEGARALLRPGQQVGATTHPPKPSVASIAWLTLPPKRRGRGADGRLGIRHRAGAGAPARLWRRPSQPLLCQRPARPAGAPPRQAGA